MEELYRLIEDKIKSAGYQEAVDGQEIYHQVCDLIEGKENGTYVLMSKTEDETFFEYRVDVMEDQFNLSYVRINQNGTIYHVDFDN